MEVELKMNPDVSGNGEIYEVIHKQERIGRIWELPTAIVPENKWGWMVLDARTFGSVASPSGRAATLEQAKTDFQRAFIF
jgi:hypothetical protein